MSRGVYMGTAFGPIQNAVFDQPAAGVHGGLYAASDINLCDTISVGEANGIDVGSGVVEANSIDVGSGVVESAIASAKISGINDLEAKLPTVDGAAIYGFVIRTQAGCTDASGKNYVPEKRQATVLRYDRVGGRFWYKMPTAFTTTSTVYIAYTDDAGGKGHLTVTAEAGKNFELTKLKIRNSGIAGDLALIEIVA